MGGTSPLEVQAAKYAVEILTALGPWVGMAIFWYMWRIEHEGRLESEARERLVSRATRRGLARVTNGLRALRTAILHGREPEPEEYEDEDEEEDVDDKRS